MTAVEANRRGPLALAALLAAVASCAPARYQPRAIDDNLVVPRGVAHAPYTQPTAPGGSDPAVPGSAAPVSTDAPAPEGELALRTVITSVVHRYPPFLAKLLERDLASGRLQQAMGGFDLNATAKVGGRLQGYYESTVAQGMLEQALATGDTVYGGYRVSDGFLPDYYSDRTQDDGEFVFGGRLPLLQNRSIDPRRANVRIGQIGVDLAEPGILAARIDYVRRATAAYYKWVAAGRRLGIARELLQLAIDRDDGLRRAVERQFLAPIALTANERLVAQRRVLVTRAERTFQAAGLGLSLYLRDEEDRPIVAGEGNLPADRLALPPEAEDLQRDLELAARQRPDLVALQLEIDMADTERALAENQTLPNLDVVVEGASSLSDGPYTDREDLELFVGGEFKLPIQRRAALGKLQQAQAKLSKLRIEQGFARDRIVNELLDTRSAMLAARQQLQDTERNVELAEELVRAEQRAFDLGRSDLLRIQLVEAQLADAQALAIDARLGLLLAHADYRAALGHGDVE